MSTRTQQQQQTKKAIEEIVYTSTLRLQLTRGTSLQPTHADYVNDTQVADYGYLVVRLLIATRGTVLQGLDQAVQRMTLGESAQVKCRFDYAYGSYCLHSHIPPRASVMMHVQIVALNNQGRDLVSLWRRMGLRVLRVVQSWSKLGLGAVCVLLGASLLQMLGIWRAKVDNKHKAKRRRMQEDSDEEEDEGEEEEHSSDSDSNADSNADEHKDPMDDDEAFHPDAQDVDVNMRVSTTLRAKDRPKTLAPDAHVKQHLNRSVRAGGSLLLGYKIRDHKPVRAIKANTNTGTNTASISGSDRGSSRKPILRSETSKLRALQEMMMEEGEEEEEGEEGGADEEEDEDGY